MTDVSDRAHSSFRRVLENRLHEIPKLAGDLEKWAEHAGVPQAAIGAVNLILDELITNVVTHGYSAGQRGEIVVDIHLAPGSLEVLLTDYAQAYDPLKSGQPDLESDVEARAIGGLGVHIVRRLADELAYERLDEGGRAANRIRIVKLLQAA